MTLAGFQQLGQSVFHVYSDALGQVLVGTSTANADDGALKSVKWRFLAAQELAMPGFMTLRAVRDGGQIADFVWDFASAAAARLLSHNSRDLLGKRLLDVLSHHPGRSAVFDQYRRAVERGSAEAIRQVHVVNGAEDTYRHGAVRLGDGVAVTLTNLSAVMRAQALRQQLDAQHAMMTKNSQ